jgi:hypothetical protein
VASVLGMELPPCRPRSDAGEGENLQNWISKVIFVGPFAYQMQV